MQIYDPLASVSANLVAVLSPNGGSAHDLQSRTIDGRVWGSSDLVTRSGSVAASYLPKWNAVTGGAYSLSQSRLFDNGTVTALDSTGFASQVVSTRELAPQFWVAAASRWSSINGLVGGFGSMTLTHPTWVRSHDFLAAWDSRGGVLLATASVPGITIISPEAAVLGSSGAMTSTLRSHTPYFSRIASDASYSAAVVTFDFDTYTDGSLWRRLHIRSTGLEAFRPLVACYTPFSAPTNVKVTVSVSNDGGSTSSTTFSDIVVYNGTMVLKDGIWVGPPDTLGGSASNWIRRVKFEFTVDSVNSTDFIRFTQISLLSTTPTSLDVPAYDQINRWRASQIYTNGSSLRWEPTVSTGPWDAVAHVWGQSGNLYLHAPFTSGRVILGWNKSGTPTSVVSGVYESAVHKLRPESGSEDVQLGDASLPWNGLFTKGQISIYRPAGNLFMLGTVTGEAHGRFSVDTSGGLEWGSGAATRDVNLYRSTANVLKTDDTLDVGGSLTVQTGNLNVVAGEINGVKRKLNSVNISLSGSSVDEIATVHASMTNKLRFVSPILQEESTNGSVWTTSTRATVNQLADLMIGEGVQTTINAIPALSVGGQGHYRLTWDSTVTGYVSLNTLYAYCSTSGNDVTFKIERYHNTTGWATLVTGVGSAWPGHLFIPHTQTFFNVGSTYYGMVRVTFSILSATLANPFQLNSLEWYGSFPAGSRDPALYDRNKNVVFPAELTAKNRINLTGSTFNTVIWNANGQGAPTFTTQSVGTKLVLNPALSGSSADFALGVESNALWSSVGTSAHSFKWYAGTTSILTLSGAGNLTASGSLVCTSAQLSSGGLVITNGGMSAASTATGLLADLWAGNSQTARIGYISMGRASSGYPLLGFNFTATTTGDVYNYTASNYASAWEFASGNIRSRHADTGTLGTAITWVNRLLIPRTGNMTIDGNTVFHTGIDGAGSTFDADLLDGVQGANYSRLDAIAHHTLEIGTQQEFYIDAFDRNSGTYGTGSVGWSYNASIRRLTLQGYNNWATGGSALGALYFTVPLSGTAEIATQTWASATFAALSHNQAWSTITSTPTTVDGYGITDGVKITRTLGTQHSLTGGGTLAADRTLSLVNDEASPTASKYYGTNVSGTKGWWALPSAAGTVTSVGLAAPSFLTVTGSPVTSSGTLTLALASQTANSFFAAPNGAAGTPSFRAMVAADVPSLAISKITSLQSELDGKLSLASGGSVNGNTGFLGDLIAYAGVYSRSPNASTVGATNRVAVFATDPSSSPQRIYSRTLSEFLSDIGAAASSHTHSYLPLSGGQLSGTLDFTGSSSLTYSGASSFTVSSVTSLNLNSSTDLVLFSGSGYSVITNCGTLRPAVNNVTWLGSPSYRWGFVFGEQGEFNHLNASLSFKLPNAAPGSAASCNAYFDAATNKLWIYNGSAWKSVTLT